MKIKNRIKQNFLKDFFIQINDGQFIEEVHKRTFPGYLVIGRSAKDAGVFSDYLVFLGEIEFAVARGYTPIIDLLNYPRFCIQEKNKYYKENSWEYFFEQPCEVGMKHIKELRGHIVYAPHDFGEKVFHGMKMHRIWNENSALFNYWKEIAHRYIRFNKDTLKELQLEEKRMFEDAKGKIVGVAIREGYNIARRHRGYAGGGYDEHDVSIRQFIEEVQKLISLEQKIYGIFVSCEFVETIQKFKKYFPNKKVYYVEKERFLHPKKYPYNPEQREVFFEHNDKKTIALNYIKEIYLLSKCDCYIYSECSGSVAALLLKEGEFENRICI